MRIHPATENAELKVEVLEGIQPTASTPGVQPPSSTSPGDPDGARSPGRPPRAQFVSDEQFVEQSVAQRHADRKLLLVTQAVKEELDAEVARKAELKEREAKEEERAKIEAAVAEGLLRQAESDKKAQDEAQRLRRKGVPIGNTDPHTFHDQLEALPVKRKLRVYDPDALEKLRESKLQSDSDVQKRNAAIFKELHPKGAWRRVGIPRNLDAVLALEQTHPHFSEAIRFVADRLALAKASRRPVGIPPMLLAGPPGVGKTHFCEALAKVLGVPVRRHPMDQAETSSALLGSEVTWGNTRVGLVFEMLAHGEHANPMRTKSVFQASWWRSTGQSARTAG